MLSPNDLPYGYKAILVAILEHGATERTNKIWRDRAWKGRTELPVDCVICKEPQGFVSDVQIAAHGAVFGDASLHCLHANGYLMSYRKVSFTLSFYPPRWYLSEMGELVARLFDAQLQT